MNFIPYPSLAGFSLDHLIATLSSQYGAPAPDEVATPGQPHEPDLTISADTYADAYMIYKGIVGKEPTVVDVTHWAEALATGSTFESVTASLLGSDEFKAAASAAPGASIYESYVTTLYNNVLGRDPDPAGMDWWLKSFESGTPLVDIAVSFIRSDEYSMLEGENARAWVQNNIFAPVGNDNIHEPSAVEAAVADTQELLPEAINTEEVSIELQALDVIPTSVVSLDAMVGDVAAFEAAPEVELYDYWSDPYVAGLFENLAFWWDDSSFANIDTGSDAWGDLSAIGVPAFDYQFAF